MIIAEPYLTVGLLTLVAKKKARRTVPSKQNCHHAKAAYSAVEASYQALHSLCSSG